MNRDFRLPLSIMENPENTIVQATEAAIEEQTPADVHFTTFLNVVTQKMENIHAHRRDQRYGKGHVWSTQIEIDSLKLILEIYYNTNYTDYKSLILHIHHSNSTIMEDEECCGDVRIEPFRAEESYDASNPEKIKELWNLIVSLRNYKVCPFYRTLIAPEEFDKWQAEVSMGAFVRGYTTECSVCFTLTKTHTDCGYPLCIKCWQKFRDMKKTKCPCCRQRTLPFMSKSPCINRDDEYEDSDESDDE